MVRQTLKICKIFKVSDHFTTLRSEGFMCKSFMKKIENESVCNFLFKNKDKDTWLQDWYWSSIFINYFEQVFFHFIVFFESIDYLFTDSVIKNFFNVNKKASDQYSSIFAVALSIFVFQLFVYYSCSPSPTFV